MERRVGSVLRRVLAAGQAQNGNGQSASATNAAIPALPWSGTFHAIGARLLRNYAPRIGLDDAFTIHDRGDAEDLVGLVRHDLGLSATKNRFPQKGTCLAIYSRVVNTQETLAEVLKSTFPWCAQWEAELKKLFRGYVEAKQAQNVLDYDDLLLFWSEMAGEPTLAAELGAQFDHTRGRGPVHVCAAHALHSRGVAEEVRERDLADRTRWVAVDRRSGVSGDARAKDAWR